jgi:hypothetical protein
LGAVLAFLAAILDPDGSPSVLMITPHATLLTSSDRPPASYPVSIGLIASTRPPNSPRWAPYAIPPARRMSSLPCMESIIGPQGANMQPPDWPRIVVRQAASLLTRAITWTPNSPCGPPWPLAHWASLTHIWSFLPIDGEAKGSGTVA